MDSASQAMQAPRRADTVTEPTSGTVAEEPSADRQQLQITPRYHERENERLALELAITRQKLMETEAANVRLTAALARANPMLRQEVEDLKAEFSTRLDYLYVLANGTPPEAVATAPHRTEGTTDIRDQVEAALNGQQAAVAALKEQLYALDEEHGQELDDGRARLRQLETFLPGARRSKDGTEAEFSAEQASLTARLTEIEAPMMALRAQLRPLEANVERLKRRLRALEELAEPFPPELLQVIVVEAAAPAVSQAPPTNPPDPPAAPPPHPPTAPPAPPGTRPLSGGERYALLTETAREYGLTPQAVLFVTLLELVPQRQAEVVQILQAAERIGLIATAPTKEQGVVTANPEKTSLGQWIRRVAKTSTGDWVYIRKPEDLPWLQRPFLSAEMERHFQAAFLEVASAS